MIFDLKSGKRRRVVQVVFGFLAFIFFISFVGFGIGSDVSGGIFDAIGIGGGDSSSSPQYEQQIEDANETLESDPANERALLALSSAYFRSATDSGVTVDPQTGVPDLSEEARTDLERSVDAWQRYLDTKPKRPQATAAAEAAQAYQLLLDPAGAAKAQQIVADDQRTSAAYAQLAYFLYANGDLEAGDAAGDDAVEAAAEADRAAVEKRMDQLAKLARKQERAIAKQQKDLPQGQAGAEIENPFGGLSGGGAAPLPAP